MLPSEIIKKGCCGNLLDDKYELVEMVEALERQVSDQERKIEDKTRLTKFVDKANSQLATENKALECQVIFLNHRLENANAEIQRRPKR